MPIRRCTVPWPAATLAKLNERKKRNPQELLHTLSATLHITGSSVPFARRELAINMEYVFGLDRCSVLRSRPQGRCVIVLRGP
jgi:hypothetical protein